MEAFWGETRRELDWARALGKSQPAVGTALRRDRQERTEPPAHLRVTALTAITTTWFHPIINCHFSLKARDEESPMRSPPPQLGQGNCSILGLKGVGREH